MKLFPAFPRMRYRQTSFFKKSSSSSSSSYLRSILGYYTHEKESLGLDWARESAVILLPHNFPARNHLLNPLCLHTFPHFAKKAIFPTSSLAKRGDKKGELRKMGTDFAGY